VPADSLREVNGLSDAPSIEAIEKHASTWQFVLFERLVDFRKPFLAEAENQLALGTVATIEKRLAQLPQELRKLPG
jgi:hypothetical protein